VDHGEKLWVLEMARGEKSTNNIEKKSLVIRFIRGGKVCGVARDRRNHKKRDWFRGGNKVRKRRRKP